MRISLINLSLLVLMQKDEVRKPIAQEHAMRN